MHRIDKTWKFVIVSQKKTKNPIGKKFRNSNLFSTKQNNNRMKQGESIVFFQFKR